MKTSSKIVIKTDYNLSEKEESELITNINETLKTFEQLITIHYPPEILILKGWKICELMTRLILKKEGYDIDDYMPFGQIISLALQNKVIPQECGNFLKVIMKYRNETAHLNKEITGKVLLTFLNAFNYFIQWFDNYYSNKYGNTKLNTYLCSYEINNLNKSPGYYYSKDYDLKLIMNDNIKPNMQTFEKSDVNSNVKKIKPSKKKKTTQSPYVKKIEQELSYKNNRLQIEELEKTRLQKEIKNLKTKLKEQNDQIENLKTKLKEQEEEIIDLKRQKELQPIYLESMDNYAKSFGDALENILNKVTEIDAKTEVIDDKIDNIDRKLDSIKNQITQFQKEAEKNIKNASSPEEIEKIIEKFINRCVKNIIKQTEHLLNNQDYENEKAKLIKSLGKSAWNKLSEKSKTFLITSKVMYKKLSETSSTIDYSGICILVTKALEVEMKKRFYSKFLEYLDKKYNRDYSEYPTALLYHNKTPLFSEKFTMGSIAYVLCYKKGKHNKQEQENNNQKKLMEYCKSCIFSQLTDIEINNLLNEYAISIEEIKETYRNPSAHTNEIKKIDAEECFNLLIDVEKLLKKMLDSFDT